MLVLENNDILWHCANKSGEDLIAIFIEVCRYPVIAERILGQVAGRLKNVVEDRRPKKRKRGRKKRSKRTPSTDIDDESDEDPEVGLPSFFSLLGCLH